MKIKSAKSFRQWYKNLIPGRKHAPQYYDENFMGVQHKNLSGFLSMYHGDKEDIYGFLRKEVEMAEDGQAIYEFVQNAADSNSTQFYMLYDKSHLIVINNGNEFSKDGVKSILNIGQSFGKEDPDKIGRYGIGFKLVHRLVGKSSGLDELFNTDEKGYRGPILFSWSEKSQLDNFLKTDENEFEYVDFNENDSPWLLKILITNFPAQPKEKVKDIDFNEVEPFNTNELLSFQAFLNSCKDKIDLNSLNSGTIFFLKLGDEKFDYLERQQQEYLNGLSTSMHFLKSLDTLVVNDNIVTKDQEANNVLEFIVKNGTDDFNNLELTEARDKESDAKFKICFADNATSANEIKKHPNIYKYFPAVKEVNNLSFVVHSNLFELSSNRQNLTDTPINRNLLSLLSKQVIGKMEESKFGNRNLFKKLFTSILMSDESSSSSSGSGWQNDFFYGNLLSYIRDSIPTKKDSYSNNVANVKINKLKTSLNLTDFGLGHINWFEWDNESDRLLIDEATTKEKLGIEEWDIRDIVENSAAENINNWLSTCDEKSYREFMKELEESYLRQETKEKLCHLKLFKFSNGAFYSFDEAISVRDMLGKTTFKFSNCFFNTNKTKAIKKELIKLDFVISELSIESYPSIFASITLPEDKKLYELIADKCKTNTLSAQEKRNVFLNFTNEATKFDNVDDETIKKLELFCDSQNIVKPLSELVSSSQSIPKWLNSYKIKTEENLDFIQLNSYLIQENELFEKIVLPNIEVIKDELTEAKQIKELVTFFKENHRSFFNEFIIQKSSIRFAIIDKSDKYQIIPSKDERKTFISFIESNLSDNFIVLPYDFSDFNDQDGILKGEILHSQILELVDVDEHKETLVDIVHYNEPKRKLLREISKFSFNSETEYTKEDYEYKILDLACNELNDNDFQAFRNKVIIKTGVRSFNLSEIPPIVDKIKIATKEFRLSKILPSTYENNNLISDLITKFTKQGIPIEKLKALFGVNEEIDIDDIFEKFTEQTETLQNPEQFFFLIYYHKHIINIDLSKLGFDFTCAVFPSEFALETEKLPEYIQQWIKQDEIKISNLESIGIYTENSTLVSLRKFFLTENDFNLNTIAQDEKLSDGKMLFNTFEIIKEKEIELKSENEFAVFKEMLRVINSSRANIPYPQGQEMIIQEEYNFALMAEHSTEWKSIGEFSIYLFNGKLPKIVKLDEIQDYVFYRYNDSDYAVNGNKIYINENEDETKTLQKVAIDEKNDFTSEDSKDIELSEVKAELEKYKKQGQTKEDNTNTSFLDNVNEFMSELEGTEWAEYQSDLKSLLQGFTNQPLERQKLFNLIAKIKLTKKKGVKFEDSDGEFNVVKIGNEKYFVHSARGAFAYIHPNEILKMNKNSYKMALDFGKNFKIYNTAKEILELNSIHLLAYKNEREIEELFTFCEANRDANKHLLIIDKNNSGEKSRALLKLLNIEDDYQ